MALWQYDFIIIPKKSLPSSDSKSISRDFYHQHESWLNGYKLDDFKEFEKILPRTKWWTDKIILFGEEDSNRFEVTIDKEERVSSVRLRIDFRENFVSLLEKIFDFLDSLGLVMLDEELNVVPSDPQAVVEIIRNSDQLRMLKKLSGGQEK